MKYIDRDKWLQHLDRVTAWNRGGTPAPVTVEWDLSNRCVLGCQDCHFAHTHVRGPWSVLARSEPVGFESTGGLADMDLVTRALQEMSVAGVLGVIWSGGGEPTTHPRWQAALAAARLAGLKSGMYTLGGLLSERSAANLASLAEWVVVSLDAPDAERYSKEKRVPRERFDVACNGVRWLAGERRAVVGVSFLLHSGNWQLTGEMLALSRSLGASYTTFRPAIQTVQDRPGTPTGDRAWVSQALPRLERLAELVDVQVDPSRFAAYRDWAGHNYTACHGIRLTTTVTPDGRVWVCPQRRGVMDGSLIGDLSRESFTSIWARHPREWTDFSGCRAMCRLHLMNEGLASMGADSAEVPPFGVHREFV